MNTVEVSEELSQALVSKSGRDSDGELLTVIAAGGRHALEKLYLAYHPRLARFLRRFTRRHENIDEIIAESSSLR